MRLLQREPDVNQREIAHRLGTSLGKAHQCVQALLSRGWVQSLPIRGRLNRVGYRYPLTDVGQEEKRRLTAQSLWRAESEILRLQDELTVLRQELQQEEAANSSSRTPRPQTTNQARKRYRPDGVAVLEA
jgi:DNA-binding MarR family transcriptional regulator